MRLLEKVKTQSPIVLDGGLATTLEQAGCDLNSSLWSSEVLRHQPIKIKQAHQDFTNAGADIILTSTYQASYQTFTDIGMQNEEIDDLFTIAVEQVMDATNNNQVVVGSLGPYGAYLSDGSEYTGNYVISREAYFKFHEQRINALISRGINDFVFETVPNFEEIQAIIENIIPSYTEEQTFWISVTVDDTGNLSDGTEFEKLIDYIKQKGTIIPIFGINCSSVKGINRSLDKGLASLSQTIALYPNGGSHYNADSKKWENDANSDEIIEQVPKWLMEGVQIIGGCCQTTPEDIKKIKHSMS
ncbi:MULTISPECIES: homocysteine S-methyltransferase [Staphylococcus]|uniref:homocysteine S-methyltransferase n=1 Tax=Staphylococcus TaxID=1279 RepID=UPI000281E737|nr:MULTISPECIES: homocysteine S-methyltransferase [Staphylococcus]ANR67314.1 homocysteine S-methyltransferase [Staphylococcus equorum]EJX17080.1 homocysteine methyltransferase [Staphylococcus sp. OJ82]ERH34464.1 homocysteine S-methyltransferase [Staphylococcus equorum UMC-CNS-924]MCE5048818.1 homocysteine S-methyltransferase [Staphylococcus equorum]MDK9860112.1 homocysteine S-methyltransferase [Staphylococcus equorum]